MTVFEEGYQAFLSGCSITDNPYAGDDSDPDYFEGWFKDWTNGWLAAERWEIAKATPKESLP